MLPAVNSTAVSLSDQLGFSFKPPERRVWTVRELVAAVRTQLEREYSDAWIEGEISNFRAHDSGHLYFTLKDQSSQIRIVMFRSQARLLRFRPEDGMQVVVRGRVTIYEGRGELQVSAEYLEPKGAGALQIAPDQPGVDFDALERARVVLVQAWRNDLTPDEITVTPQGGVTIAWRRAGWALELIVDPFALSAFRLDSPSKMVEWTRAGSEATIADAKAALAAMAGDSAKPRPQAAAS